MTKEELERIKQRTNDGYTTFPEVRELIAEIERLQSEREWRDISTAPKDKYILVYPASYNNVASCAKWDEDSYAKRPRPYWRRSDADITRSRSRPPTHWMPMPSAPEGGKE